MSSNPRINGPITNGPKKKERSRIERRDKYMSQLSPEMVQDLYELYKIDFEMFGYD